MGGIFLNNMQENWFTHSKNSLIYQNLRSTSEKKAFLTSLLPTYKLSATHLIKYKKCSNSFLFECLLKIKTPPNAAMLKGTIAHNLLDWIFKSQKNNQVFPTVEMVEHQFLIILQKEQLKNNLQLTTEEIDELQKLIIKYYNSNKYSWNTIAITEFYILKHIWNAVPLTGFIDKIEFNGRNVNLVDYKTGNIELALQKTEKGNDYWLQLVFYAILLEDFKPNWKVDSVELCMISEQNNTFLNKKIQLSSQDKAEVKEEITSNFDLISNLKFDGCQQENCYWCTNQLI